MKTLLVTLIAVLLLNLMPWHGANIENSDDLIGRRPDDRYDELCDFIADGAVYDKSRFWMVTRGISGSFHRIRLSRYDLRIVQARRAEGYISSADTAVVWCLLAGQLILTILAIPEAALCRLFGNRPIAAIQALKLYCDLVLRAHTLYTYEH
jgi:hypothetical protein